MVGNDILCENERPKILYVSANKTTLRYKTLKEVNDSSQIESLRGFKLYFEAYSLIEPPITTEPQPSFTRSNIFKEFRINKNLIFIFIFKPFFFKVISTSKSSNLLTWGLIVGIALIVTVICLIVITMK